jgi:hypothetical protein
MNKAVQENKYHASGSGAKGQHDGLINSVALEILKSL